MIWHELNDFHCRNPFELPFYYEFLRWLCALRAYENECEKKVLLMWNHRTMTITYSWINIRSVLKFRNWRVWNKHFHRNCSICCRSCVNVMHGFFLIENTLYYVERSTNCQPISETVLQDTETILWYSYFYISEKLLLNRTIIRKFANELTSTC